MLVPRYVRIGHPIHGTALRLTASSFDDTFEYYRDGGRWSTKFYSKDGRLIADSKNLSNVDGQELFPSTREEYIKDNGRYVDPNMLDDDFPLEMNIPVEPHRAIRYIRVPISAFEETFTKATTEFQKDYNMVTTSIESHLAFIDLPDGRQVEVTVKLNTKEEDFLKKETDELTF